MVVFVTHNVNKHVFALKGNKEIFYNVFKPLAYDHPNEGFNDKKNDQEYMFDDDDDISSIIY